MKQQLRAASACVNANQGRWSSRLSRPLSFPHRSLSLSFSLSSSLAAISLSHSSPLFWLLQSNSKLSLLLFSLSLSAISLSILFPQQKPAASKLCSFPRSLSIFSHSNGRNGLWVSFRFYSHYWPIKQCHCTVLVPATISVLVRPNCSKKNLQSATWLGTAC